MEEEWREIEGFNGMYLISNKGRVKSYKQRKEKFLSTHKTHGNYIIVNLSSNGKNKSYRLHRLVAKAFIPNVDNKPDVNHIDGDKSNNRSENLEWCTKSENMKHASKTGLFVPYNKGKHGKDCHSSKKVAMLDRNTGKIVRYFESEKEGALFLGKKDKSNISSCCSKRSNTANGYMWEFI